ncbi:MAG: DEAD/DEAH box helicase family protein [bacterium]
MIIDNGIGNFINFILPFVSLVSTQLPTVMELIKVIHDNRLDADPINLGLIRAIALGDTSKIAILLRRIQPKILWKQLCCSPFQEPDDSVDGPIRIASNEQNKPVGIYPYEPHVLLAGQTGSGKTTVMLLSFVQAIIKGINTWLFTKSTEIRNLLHATERIFFVRFQGLEKIGSLLTHPFLPRSAWANIWADIFCQAFAIYDGTKNFLIEHLNKLYALNPNPTLLDLYNQIKNSKYPLMSREARYRESALNRLGGILSSGLGKTLEPSDVELVNLVESSINIVWEIQYLTIEQQVFIVNLLTAWLFHYKLHLETEKIHFIGLDDGNALFDASFEHRPDRGLPEISHLVSMARHAKIYLWACTQIPHQMGASIHSNAFTKIMFSLTNGKDIDCMINSMGITDKAQREYCHRLKEREIVVKFSGRYTAPFLARVPDLKNYGGQ